MSTVSLSLSLCFVFFFQKYSDAFIGVAVVEGQTDGQQTQLSVQQSWLERVHGTQFHRSLAHLLLSTSIYSQAAVLIIIHEDCPLWIPMITTAGGGPGDAPEGLRTEVNASEIGVVKLYFLLG